MDKKKVLFFGIFDKNYPRNRIISLGLRENGWQVTNCKVDPKIGGLRKYWRLYQEYKKLEDKKFDLVLVAFPGHTVVWLARILFGRKLIFDAHISLYDSNVFDRKIYPKFSFGAIKDWFLDWSSCSLAQKVLLDTYEHVSYFVDEFHISRSKFIRVLVGADNTVFYPRKKQINTKGEFTVHFHGTFIPLQGISYIVEAANELRDKTNIKFVIVGAGGELFEQTKAKVSELKLNNIIFTGRVPYKEVPSYIAKSNVCLGIFGNTPKARRVIPNKAYECVAMGIPTITAETAAIKELFTNKKDMLFCEIANGKDLAQKILFLKNNPAETEEIANNGYQTFQNNVFPKEIGYRLIEDLGI